jgi:uracil-DNA glycosylase family 4
LTDDELSTLTEKIKICVACHLKDNRTQVVPGIYGPRNSCCFVGEAPGFYEDRQGLPFVGKSGKILDKMLENIGLKREEHSSILNVVKCRPTTEDGNNRPPTDSESRFCGERWLMKQIKLLSPKLIITLGAVALKFFLPKVSVTKSVGEVFDTDLGIKLFVTYHPAYILRNYNLLEEYERHFAIIKELNSGISIKNQHTQAVEGEKQIKSKSEQKSLTDFF